MKQWMTIAAIFLVLSFASTAMASDSTEALLKIDRDFAREAQTLRVEAWVKYFADNGIRQMGDGVVTGKEGIRRQMSVPYSNPDFNLEWEPVRAELSRGGRLGYTWGRFKSTRKGPDGKVVTRRGSYITIWEKQKDGSWRVLFDTGDGD